MTFDIAGRVKSRYRVPMRILANGASMRLTLAFAVVAALMLPSLGHAQRAVQVSPDGQNLLISKPLNGQQWSIIVNFDAQTIAGNVFNFDGSDPQFVYCDIVAPVIESPADFTSVETVALDCRGADGCGALPCSPAEWTDLGQVAVIASFFLPLTAPLPTATPLAIVTPGRTLTPARTPTPTPVQHHPACGSAQCDLNWCGTSIEDECPAYWATDGVCDCGCQFDDTVCTSAPVPTATPGGGGFCCKHCTNGKPCGDSCISWSYTCHQPPGCACF